MNGLTGQTKTVVLVGRITNTAVLKRCLKAGDYTCIALTVETQKRLTKEGIGHSSPSQYLTSGALTKIEQSAFSWVKTWARKKIQGKSFIEWVDYKDASLWWFIERPVYESLLGLIKDIELVRTIVEKEKTNRIVFLGSHPVEGILAQMKELEIESLRDRQFNISLSLRHFMESYPYIAWHLYCIYELFKSLLARVVGAGKPRHVPLKKRVLIWTHNDGWQPVRVPMTAKPIKDDIRFRRVVENLIKDFEIITTDRLDSTPGNIFSALVKGLRVAMGKKRSRRKVLHQPFERYLTLTIERKINRERKRLIKNWRCLKRNRDFQNSWLYKGVNLWQFLEKDFSFLVSFVLSRAIRYIATAEHMIEMENPNLILLSAETANFPRALLIAGKLKSVPTLALQVGVYAETGVDFVHIQEEISPQGSVRIPFCPLPDKTAVYGPHYENSLTQRGAYPPSSIAITGQPMYDILARADKIFNKKAVFQRLNLNERKKMVLWTTQSHGFTREENERIFYAVYEAMKELKDEAQLVVKLHPAGEVDTSQHKEIAKKVGLDFPIVKDIDTYELIYACDVLLTISSTTAIEASILNKPVVIVNLTGRPDQVAYVREGMALGVYNEKELVPTLRRALYDSEARLRLEEEQRRFVYDYAYIQDGQASNRLADVIRQMISKSNGTSQ